MRAVSVSSPEIPLGHQFPARGLSALTSWSTVASAEQPSDWLCFLWC